MAGKLNHQQKVNQMKIRLIAPNVTEIQLNGISLLYSYETPVAGWDDQGAFRTTKFHSVTTSKHINKYLGKDVGRKVSQESIDDIANV